MKINPNASSAIPLQSSAPAAAKPPVNKALMGVAKNFEALFINQMLGAMRKTISKDGLVPEGPGEKVYQGMLDSEYAQQMSQTETLGLSKMIYDHLLRSSRGG